MDPDGSSNIESPAMLSCDRGVGCVCTGDQCSAEESRWLSQRYRDKQAWSEREREENVEFGGKDRSMFRRQAVNALGDR
jgi:hypothetical protein